MPSYAGRHAELYDIFYADKPYEDEAAFVNQCIMQHGTGPNQRLLELACGTGSHALAFEKLGYDIVAIDNSEDMLKAARSKANAISSEVDFLWQDMRNLNLSYPCFDVAICLFDSIGYVRANQALKQMLRGVHNHLRPNGLFLFEFWNATAMLRNFEPLRIRKWKISEGEILRISETNLDLANQLAHVAYTIYELRNDGTYSIIKETQINRFFLVQEMAELLSSCSFLPLKFFAGFTSSEIITDKTWHILAIAQKG